MAVWLARARERENRPVGILKWQMKNGRRINAEEEDKRERARQHTQSENAGEITMYGGIISKR